MCAFAASGPHVRATIVSDLHFARAKATSPSSPGRQKSLFTALRAAQIRQHLHLIPAHAAATVHQSQTTRRRLFVAASANPTSSQLHGLRQRREPSRGVAEAERARRFEEWNARARKTMDRISKFLIAVRTLEKLKKGPGSSKQGRHQRSVKPGVDMQRHLALVRRRRLRCFTSDRRQIDLA